MVTNPYTQNSYVSPDQARLTLSPNRLKDIQLLIGSLVFQGFKPITLELRGRRGGGFLGSSLPNHDSKGLKKGKTETKKENQGQTALERVSAQKYQ